MSRPACTQIPPTSPAPAPTARVGDLKVKKASPLPTLSPYRIAFYCARCARWVLREDASFDKAGRPRCPRCGGCLRTRPAARWEA